jgi:hypothetical protein
MAGKKAIRQSNRMSIRPFAEGNDAQKTAGGALSFQLCN